SRGVCLRGTTKAQDGPGALNVPIHIGDVTVEPGDFVVGDRDGVTVVPAAEQAEVLQRSAEREAHETSIINRLREGQRLLDLVT
ncbi:MAG: 4-hydroxy-4-methyl-2-oxoglutarate aldolase, partial [Gemmatimonadetes bacterium]|nr:4-hydroxy-4-methyl-2-oxoglutarate aldolase [Gemmatimonadota bacterium]